MELMDAVCSENLLNKAAGKLVCSKHGTAILETRISETPSFLNRQALTTSEAKQRREKKHLEKQYFRLSLNYPAARFTHS